MLVNTHALTNIEATFYEKSLLTYNLNVKEQVKRLTNS